MKWGQKCRVNGAKVTWTLLPGTFLDVKVYIKHNAWMIRIWRKECTRRGGKIQTINIRIFLFWENTKNKRWCIWHLSHHLIENILNPVNRAGPSRMLVFLDQGNWSFNMLQIYACKRVQLDRNYNRNNYMVKVCSICMRKRNRKKLCNIMHGL